MKLKVRVKRKDFLFFVIICLILFLVLSVVSLNFVSLSDSGDLVGLDFSSYNGRVFALTILLFSVSLVAIFMSVSNTIFDFEKGGLGLVFGDKEEKGYNRWSTLKEMKSAAFIKKINVSEPTSEAGGIVLVNDGKSMWVDDGEYHTLIIGQSGSGKTSALVDPQVYSLTKHGESMVITDPKGEIYRHHANRLKANGYKLVVINFRDPKEGNAWNPLTIPYRMYKQGKTDKAKELLEDISQNILVDPKNTNDPFWESSASSYFSGLALGLFEDAKENEVNISSISNMATVGEEKNGLSNFAKDYFNLKGETSSSYGYAKATIMAPNDTKASILSVFQDKIRKFSTREELSEMLSYSDFNMEDIGKEKTAVFIIVHDEKTTYHSLATIFIKQLYEVLIDVAHKSPGGALKYRTNFILDEFANMPALKDVTSMVTAARSRKIRFTFIIQNFAQLDEVYGDKNAETIRSNCGNMIYLLTNELGALEEISKLCGEVKSKEKDKTVSTPLVTVTDLQKMKRNEIIVIRMRMRPFRTVLKGAYEIDWGDKFEEANIPERDAYPVKLFDMKTYVKEGKRKQTVNAIEKAQGPGNLNMNNPSGGFGGFGGFGGGMGSGLGGNAGMGNMPGFNSNMDIMGSNFGKLDGNSNPFGGDKPIDIDELVKNIDAQIAELEKEEAEEKARKEKEKLSTSNSASKDDSNFNVNIDTNKISELMKPSDTLEKTVDEQKSKTEVFDKTTFPFANESSNATAFNTKKSNDLLNTITDDEFFDDFFGDE